ncbi:MAG: response regulator, partial [Bdellovibrionales bacterium]|nr:response regulator [Bdellovibrionales bacterium]
MSQHSLFRTLGNTLGRLFGNPPPCARTSSAECKEELKIEDLCAGIAHDAKNMLAATIGHLQRLEKLLAETKDPHIIQHLKDSILGCRHVSSLLDEWKHARHVESRHNGSTSCEIQVQQLLGDIVRIIAPLAPDHVALRFHPDATASIWGTRHQLEQAIINLLYNSFHAIKDEGEVFVSTFRDEGSVIIEIRDTGEGMAPETLERIFNPRFSTRKSNGGSGLGLSMARRCIVQHGGEISVSSSLGTGTTFRISLPIYHSSKPSENSSTIDSQKFTKIHQGTILLIDDTLPMLEVMKEFLQDSGLQTITFSNPESAVDWFSKHSNETDMILLDLHMPELSGEECFQALQKVNPQIPIAIYSGMESEESHRLLEQGAVKFFQKPFDYNVTTRWIQDAIATARGKNIPQ